MSEWISVKEKMPSDLEYCLITAVREVGEGYYWAERGGWYLTRTPSQDLREHVTHWMPLPEPPEV